MGLGPRGTQQNHCWCNLRIEVERMFRIGSEPCVSTLFLFEVVAVVVVNFDSNTFHLRRFQALVRCLLGSKGNVTCGVMIR